MGSKNDDLQWKEVITSGNSLFHFNFSEIWEYRDLLLIWVKRDISAIYKQTLLGPLWFFLQPVLTTLVYLVIFQKIANLSTSGIPPVLFYLSGIILWSYFAECVIKTSSFLKDNTAIFSKVYFPRLIIPLSIILTNLVKFSIQFTLFLTIYVYYLATTSTITITSNLLLLPLLLVMTALLGLGAGLIVASLTIKYKDLSHLVTFGIQLLMFISTVFYPLDKMDDTLYATLVKLNPMSGVIESFRITFTGSGMIPWNLLGYDLLIAIVLILLGLILFSKTEKSFVDTI